MHCKMLVAGLTAAVLAGSGMAWWATPIATGQQTPPSILSQAGLTSITVWEVTNTPMAHVFQTSPNLDTRLTTERNLPLSTTNSDFAGVCNTATPRVA